jgi:hypothetical protein
MKTGWKILLGIGAGVAIHQWYVASVQRPYRKLFGYAIASDRARATRKPLVIVGDPMAGNYTWFGKPDYPCGDLAIDIEAANCPNGIKDDLRNVLPQMQDNSCVLYASATLEYIDNLSTVMPELLRVTGGDLFVTNVEPDSLKAILATNFGYHFKRKWKIYTNANYQITSIVPITA